jgi:hypothetical protein
VGKFKSTPQAKKLLMRYKLLQFDDQSISEQDRAKLLDNMIKNDLEIKFDRIQNNFSKEQVPSGFVFEEVAALQSKLDSEKIFANTIDV